MTEDSKVENAVNESTTAPPSIGLADLQNAVKIIDYAAEQGAFKGWTVIEQVISVRNKLNAFVAYSSPKDEPQVQEPAQASVPTPVKKPAKTSKKVR